MTSEMGHKAVHDLRADLFGHLQRLSLRFYDRHPSRAVMVCVTNDVNALQEPISNGAIHAVIYLAQLLGFIVILLALMTT